ncbi:MAG: maleate cis-trans isomerase family protein [Marinibacterium sp.]
MNAELASTRLGMLTPSSNTVLEPLTAAILAGLPDTTAHFGRFRVLKISMDDDALGQFTNEPMLAAADLLADAQVQSICWNGTSAGWLGFDRDRALIAEIEARTGIKGCSSILGMNELLTRIGAKRIAFVTPYLPEIQDRILANYRSEGFDIVAEKHLNDAGNFSFASYSEAHILDLCRSVATAKPDAILIYCTNFRGAGMATTIESETGIPVLDSVSTALWQSMLVAGDDPRRIKGWGSLFEF